MFKIDMRGALPMWLVVICALALSCSVVALTGCSANNEAEAPSAASSSSESEGTSESASEASESSSSTAKAQKVEFTIDAPEYNRATDSKVAVHVTGTDAAGKSIDERFFVNPDEAVAELAQGEYEAEVPASPLMASGRLYKPIEAIAFTVDKEGKATVDQNGVATDLAFAFEFVDETEMTAQAIDDASQAAKDSGFRGDIDALVKLARERMVSGQASAMAPVYNDIVAAYEYAASNPGATDIVTDYVNTQAIAEGASNMGTLNYSIVDLTGDGVAELLVSRVSKSGAGTGTTGMASSYRLYDIFTAVNGAPVRTSLVGADGVLGSDVLMYIGNDNVLRREPVDIGNGERLYQIMRLSDDGTSADVVAVVIQNGETATYTNEKGESTQIAASEITSKLNADYPIRDDFTWTAMTYTDGKASSQPSEDASAQDVLNMPFYKLTFAPEWEGASVEYDATYEKRESQSIGCITSIREGGWTLGEVICCSSDWGPQGAMATRDLGATAVDSTVHVWVCTPLVDANGDRYPDTDVQNRLNQIASNVTVL